MTRFPASCREFFFAGWDPFFTIAKLALSTDFLAPIAAASLSLRNASGCAVPAATAGTSPEPPATAVFWKKAKSGERDKLQIPKTHTSRV